MSKKNNNTSVPWGEPFNKAPWYTSYREFNGDDIKRYIFVPEDTQGAGLSSSIINAYNLATMHRKVDNWLGFTLTVKVGEAAGQEIDRPYVEVIPVREENGTTDLHGRSD